MAVRVTQQLRRDWKLGGGISKGNSIPEKKIELSEKAAEETHHHPELFIGNVDKSWSES